VSTWLNRLVTIGCCGSLWFWFCIVENQGDDTCHTRCQPLCFREMHGISIQRKSGASQKSKTVGQLSKIN
jgi:hypothetical protein